MYSGNTIAFMPNEPPTWPVRTRTSLTSTPMRVGEVGAHAEYALRADVKREAIVLVFADRRARLHAD